MTMKERPISAAAYAEARKYIPGGVDSPVRSLSAVGTTPIVAEHAEGPYVWDVDGNRFVDMCMSWGVFLLGHCHPDVTRAVREAVERGSSFGMSTVGETRLAKLVNAAFPSMERLRFVNSGTEATMSAIRVARGYTGRDTVVKFEGCYHGHADHLLVSAGSSVANLKRASSAGVPADFTHHTVCLPYNDVAAFERYMAAEGDSVAAVLVEPVACNMGVVPPRKGFLQSLRAETERHGAVLIFDEVITGFRLSGGGAQRMFGV
ncbi:aminotransferase class III-fold pyridoxal phosphate-dependent enzyme, partial [Salmonella enterica]|nr:aminotransferase class III-fold pyridoxal phosphate-dependent enzyme [Salmonella enterica]